MRNANKPSLTKHQHPSFLDNLDRLLRSSSPAIQWSEDGTCIEITSREGLVELIRQQSNNLRQTKYSSFQRQLTSYGFYKVMGKYPRDVCLYRNPQWTRDNKANNKIVRRKSSTSAAGNTNTSTYYNHNSSSHHHLPEYQKKHKHGRIDLISDAALLVLNEYKKKLVLHNSTKISGSNLPKKVGSTAVTGGGGLMMSTSGVSAIQNTINISNNVRPHNNNGAGNSPATTISA